jgi:hypothetical protein
MEQYHQTAASAPRLPVAKDDFVAFISQCNEQWAARASLATPHRPA